MRARRDHRLRRLLLLGPTALCFLLGLPAGHLPAAEGAVVRTHVLVHQGRKRGYHLVLPRGHTKSKAVPLVIALHGGGGSGRGFDRSTNGQFAREVDRRGWVVVFPEGVEKGWNDGRPLSSRRDRARTGVDDVAFIRKLIERLHTTLRIDRSRVYATGISNGGFMSFRLGLELSDRIAAIAPVTATLQRAHDGKTPRHPVGLLLLNGTQDPLVPYEGGEVRVLGRSRGRIFSTDETVRRWRVFNGCDPKPVVTRLADADPRDGTRTVRSTWSRGPGSAQVQLYRIQGGGHTWPGGRQYLPRLLIGRVARDFSAVPAIFEFFALHRRESKAPPPVPRRPADR